MISFSFSEMRRDFFSGPAITRAIASSNSSIPISLLVGPSGEDGCLIDEVRQVRPREPGSLPGQHVQLDGRVEGLIPGMDIEGSGGAP